MNNYSQHDSLVLTDMKDFLVSASDDTAIGGVQQLVFCFPNGYGASVVRGIVSYGGKAGKFELGVIRFYGKRWQLVYDTPITGDILGWLSAEDVLSYLQDIMALPSPDNMRV